MKYVFIHPAGEQFWKVKQRYLVFQRTLHQHYNLDATVVDSSSFKGKTIDTGLLCNDADVIIFHIQAAKDAAQVVQHWKARDKVVILDVSVPIVLDENNHRYFLGQSAYSNSNVLPDPSVIIDRDRLVWLMKLVDGVIVNSRQMLDDWSGIGRVFLVPDYLDMDQYLIHPYEAHDGIHIGVMIADGGMQKLRECGVLLAIETIGKRYPHTRFIFNGLESEAVSEIHLPVPQKHVIPANAMNRWLSVLPSLDIGMLPKCSPFDQRGGREDILEFMMMKVPWIASAGICCRELGQFGWVVQNNTSTWERILEDMVNNLDSYRNETAEGYLYALGQSIDENLDKFLFICYSIKTDVFSGVV